MNCGNTRDMLYFLQDTNGGKDVRNYDADFEDENANDEHDGEIYVEYYHSWINVDDLTWCEYGQEYRLPDDAISINDYSNDYGTIYYVENNMSWSEYGNEYIDNEYAVWSDYHNDYLSEDGAVDVFTDIDKNKTDRRLDGDGSYFIYINEDGDIEFYDMDLCDDENFTKVITKLDKSYNNCIYIKTEDLDKKDEITNKPLYFEWKGKWYLQKFNTELTGQLKLDI